MLTKIARVSLVIAFLAITVLTPNVSVLAQGGCVVNIAATTGPVPFTTTIEVVGPKGSTFVSFGDGSPDLPGAVHTHTYYAISNFTVTAMVNGDDGFFYRCHGYIKTISGVATVTPAPVTPTTTAVPPVFTPIVIIPNGIGGDNVSGSIQGNRNVAPNIYGNGNRVVVKIEQPTTATPAVPVIAKTTPKSFFWQFLKGILDLIVAPFNSWREWIVENK